MTLFQELWSKHSYWLIPAGWLLFSALLNLLLRKKSPEQWVAYAEKYPRLAAVIRLCSSMGIDLSKAILALKGFVNGKAATSQTPQLALVSQVVVAVIDKVEPEKDASSTEPKKEEEEEK